MTDNVYIFPTDTVWGIGTAISSGVGKKRIEEIKGIVRPRPYALIFGQIAHLGSWMIPTAPFSAVFWQEVLTCHTTLLLPVNWFKTEVVSASAGLPQIGVRLQSNMAIQKIWQIEQAPLISTSLNLTGQEPITTYEEAARFMEQFAPDAKLFSAKISARAKASTILAVEFDSSVNVPDSLIKGKVKVKVRRGLVDEHLAQVLERMGLDIDRN